MTKILLVEDLRYWRKWLADALAQTQTLLTFVENGKQAVEKIQQDSSYEATIMNVKMPIMNGYEATEKIRALGYTKPILGHSNLHDLAFVQRAFRVGMSHYLMRTPDNQDLLGALEQMGIIELKNTATAWNEDYFFKKATFKDL